MALTPIKKYTITSAKWHSQNLEVQHDGKPYLWVNANNKWGPWKNPYVTIHTSAENGEIVAAAKMGYPGWARDFRIWLGNPDCTDLNNWSEVKCIGKSAYEYRFSIGGRKFAWRRTRDKQLRLGARRKGHRDFKLIAFTPSDAPPTYAALKSPAMIGERSLLDYDPADEGELPSRIDTYQEHDSERVVAIYFTATYFRSNAREAKIHFFEDLPGETELWCLAAVMGLQEKISVNQDVFMLASFGYGGGLWPLGNYV